MSDNDLEATIETEAQFEEQTEDPKDFPVLPLRDVVVYPHMVIPLFVGREKSIVALDLAMNANKKILLVAQKDADTEAPGEKEGTR